MSNRSLIEINHDHWDAIDRNRDAFCTALLRYLNSADSRNAADLERYGVRVVGMRHHSENFVVKAGAEGFPPRYLKEPQNHDR